LKTDPELPLRGMVVAITRPVGYNTAMANLVKSLGGVPRLAPTVKIRPPEDIGRVEEFIRKATHGDIDILIFMSVKSVRSLFQVAADARLKHNLLKALGDVIVVAIGNKTQDALRLHSVEVKIVPHDHSSKGLLNSLSEIDLQGLNIGIPRSSNADEIFRCVLEKRGAKVDEVTAYISEIPDSVGPALDLIKSLVRREVDAVTFTSASTGKNLFKIAEAHSLDDELRVGLCDAIVATIGPVTSKAFIEYGVHVDVISSEHSTEALILALTKKLAERKANNL